MVQFLALFILLGVLILTVTIFIIWLLFFVLLPALRGAPFVPTGQESLKRALELIKLKSGQRIVDLGSGDGRILIAAAKLGIEAWGFEINPFLVLKTKRKIKKEGLENLAFCKWKSFWRQDLSAYDVVFVYGISYIMKGLEKKLQEELKTGAKVVSFGFSFPNWKPSIREKGIYIYQK